MEPIEKPSLRYQERSGSVNEQVVLHTLLPKIHEGFLLIDLEGIVCLINTAATNMLGVSASLFLNKRFWDVVPDGILGFSMREALLYGLGQRQLFKTIGTREIEINSYFLYEGPKHQHGLAVILKDLSEKQRIQQLLHRAERMKELGEMTAKIAHEIRNPLGGIRGFSMLLSRDLKDTPHLQEMAGQITEATKNLEHLVTTVLQYARPLQISPRTQDIAQFIQKMARLIKADPAFPASVRLLVHGAHEPLFAPFDSDALQRAVLNLAVNGWQAMPQGGLLTLSLLQSPGSCQIGVTDMGVGIAAERLEHLFEPLFTTKANGNGLGLVETKKIVQAHGGQLDVRSTPHHGTTFTITLPLRRA